MIESILKIATFTLGLYAIIPTFLARVFHVGVICRAPNVKGKLAITFDDGPDPRYTPRVLDILRQYNIKACFFVLGSKAVKYPELLKKIAAEGHEIGSHGFKHRIPWFLGPRATIRDLREAARAIERVTGKIPAYFRPPWGLFNAFSLSNLCLSGHQVVLWSFMSWDWGKMATACSISKKVMKRARDGSILVFHDSNTEPGAAAGAPEQMLSALPLILQGLRDKGLDIVPVRELRNKEVAQPGALKKLLKRIWGLWERAFQYLGRIEVVSSNRGPTLFRLALRSYRGPVRNLPDGTLLKSGDKVAELHLNNDILEGITGKGASPEKIAILTIREVRRSLPELANWLNSNPRYLQAKAILGLTMLHRGTEKLGFTTFDLSSGLGKKLVFAYQSWLLMLFHPEGSQRLRGRRDKLKPKLVAISRETLFNKYLQI